MFINLSFGQKMVVFVTTFCCLCLKKCPDVLQKCLNVTLSKLLYWALWLLHFFHILQHIINFQKFENLIDGGNVSEKNLGFCYLKVNKGWRSKLGVINPSRRFIGLRWMLLSIISNVGQSWKFANHDGKKSEINKLVFFH